MPTSSCGSDESPTKDGAISDRSSSSAGSGSLFKKKRSFGIKKFSKGKSKSRQQQQQQQLEVAIPQQQHLQQINEATPSNSLSLPPPTQDPLSPPLSPPSIPLVDPPTIAKTATSTSSSSLIESIPHLHQNDHGKDVEVVLSYTSGESGEQNNLEQSDNAFLRALRGSTSFDDEQQGDGDVADNNNVEGRTDADNASFYQGGIAAVTPTGAPITSAPKSLVPSLNNGKEQQTKQRRSSLKSDNAFLRAFRGSVGGGSSIKKSLSKDPKDSSANNASGGRSDADNAFLRAFHGGDVEGDDGISSKKGAGSSADPAKTPPPAAAAEGRSDADNAFLSAFHGEQANPSSTLTRSPRQKMMKMASKNQQSNAAGDALSNADVDFLAAMRGTPPPPMPMSNSGPNITSSGGRGGSCESPSVSSIGDASPSGHQGGKQNLGKIFGKMSGPPTLPIITSSENSKSASQDEVPEDSMADANAAFLGALHHATGDNNGGSNSNVKSSSYADGSFIYNAVPKATAKTKKNRVAPPVSRGAAKQPQPPPQSQQQPMPQSLDNDNDFLMAVRAGAAGATASAASSFNPTSFDTGGFDSGTLILNSPTTAAAVKSMERSNNNTDGDETFMMAIHANAEGTTAEGGDVPGGGEGGRKDTSEEHQSSEDEESSSDEDDDDEDIEGIKIPQHSYMEKVMMPRPLFFGHVLPPRILEEAERAKAMYATPNPMAAVDEDGATVGGIPPPPPSDDSILPSESAESADTARGGGGIPVVLSGEDSSIVSRSSVSSFGGSGGGKKFESNIPKCYRNFEGAMDVFGFGVNPFVVTSNSSSASNDAFTSPLEYSTKNNDSSTNKEPMLKAPHPYVSIYSPVWDEWARTERVKARRKRAKLIAKEEAALPKPPLSPPQPPMAEGIPTLQQPSPSMKRRHKKSMSMDFLDSLRAGGGGGGSIEIGKEPVALAKSEALNAVDTATVSSFSSVTTTDTSTAATSLSAPMAQGSIENSTDFSQDQFLKYARAGTVEDAVAVTEEDAAVAQSSSESASVDFSQDQFLKYARAGTADDDAAASGGVAGTFIGMDSKKTAATESSGNANDDFSQDQFLRYARAGTTDKTGGDAGTFIGKDFKTAATQSSGNANGDFSQDQFLRYARAGTAEDVGGDAGTFVGNSLNNKPAAAAATSDAMDSGTFVAQAPKKNNNAFSVPAFDSSTFVQAVKSSDAASDDDSIEAAEERTAVGLNDNISAAAAMLAGSEGGVDMSDDGDENRGIGTSMLLASGGGAKAANRYGRPYSNFELTNGCTPQFGCDDPSLPHESDLGVFETKEEEKRSVERRRERTMIEDFAVPGIMPHVACPNTQCSDVDDSVSWNSRLTESDLGGSGRNEANTMLISFDGNPTTTTHPEKVSSQGQTKSQLYETTRIAWWNLPDGFDETSNASGKKHHRKSKSNRRSPAAKVFPAMDDPIPLDVQTNLWPPLSLLQENNISGTRSHPATSTARFLPHLSDRPPSVRHLQIDTTAVGFPKLGGEIEPMFCKLSIYHFEMSPEKIAAAAASVAVGSTHSSAQQRDSDSVSTSASSYVLSPNMERCGRVTESLSFDVVQDPQVIENCKRALWPYSNENEESSVNMAPERSSIQNEPQSEGTPCGIFPLPENLSISNLYAVITVHKVMSDSSEVHHYYKPGRHESSHGDVPDLAKLRESAKLACEQYGQITTPFAFGVVPLKHIIGDESPKVPVSRAVQIPLFKFDPERGPQSISDHILLMLHPRADPRGGKAASMTRGHALLVMRYFGYHGLHTILKKKSSLARERLVDFTGELQVQCKSGKDTGRRNKKSKCPSLGETFVLPPWRNQYKVEPTSCGGRTVTKAEADSAVQENGASYSLYAQEIAAIPLERSIPEKSSRSRGKSSTRSKYDGMLLHRSFCNEMICQPRILLKCTKKNIVVKVELRQLKWDPHLNRDVIIPVAPSIHNTRRGPWLVQEAYSSCAMGTPQFLDEFKIKLPLVLGNEKIGLMFSVYHFNMNTKKKKRSRIMNRQSSSECNIKTEPAFSMELLGSGFLPLAQENSPTCLIANGDHEVPISFRGVSLSEAKDQSSPTQHQKKFSFSDTIGDHLRSWSMGSDSNDLRMCKSGETISEAGDKTGPLSLEGHSYPEGSLALMRLQGRQSSIVDNETQEDDSLHSESKSSRATDDARPASASGSSVKGIQSDSIAGDLKLLTSQSESSLKEPLDIEMILRVNIIAFTCVHPQNKTLGNLFSTKPNPPRSLMPSDFSEPYAPWGKYRSEILYRLKPERIPPFNFVGGALAETERKLLEPVVSLTKSSKCPHSDLMTHLVRVVTQLWRTTVSGAGEPSLIWASPESLIPLRLNAFSTLLHTVSSASHHMAKAGLRQLDGQATWDITALGRILSMLFDELAIFGGPLEDALIVSPLSNSPRKSPTNRPDILSNRSKTTDKLSLTSRPHIVARYSSEDSPKGSPEKRFDVDAMLKPTSQPFIESAGDHEADTIDAHPLNSQESGFKVDSKSDFMSALTASLNSDSEMPTQESTSRLAESLFKPSHGPAGRARRWMTLPHNALATIQENDGEDSKVSGREPFGQRSILSSKKGDSLDTELILHPLPPGEKKKSRQMRVPQVKPADDTDPLSSFLDSILPPPTDKKEIKEDGKAKSPERQRTVATDDEDIETAGTAFLDQISKSMGLGQGLGKEMGGEERRVGAAHHRKTRSRCSIDWTLPPTDMLLEKDQQMEQFNRTRSGDTAPPILPLSPLGSFPDDASSDDDAAGPIGSITGGSSSPHSPKKEHPLKRHQRSMSRDGPKPTEPVALPDFADRMSSLKNEGGEKRWWPYVYEVIIHQWVALLEEQTKKVDSKKSEEALHNNKSNTGLSPIVVKYLSHAAKAARGATIRCAPFLLDTIMQSLSWRIDCVFRDRKKKRPSLDENNCEDVVPPLIRLDESSMSALEKLITLLTDASIDSRNFDSFEYRKISIDVNDAVVRFIRDLFSILDVQLVHRLALVYFSRFVTREGKHYHDRDSKITGLRCSWEITKLRLNAITIFVRFPEFMTVCAPILESWALPPGSSVESARRFFSDALEKFSRLGLSEFTASDGPISKEPVIIPRMKPHWLAELCTDICLSATGHAEESIQFRASSLLFELFWRHSQQGRFKGNISVVASVFVPFVHKVLSHLEYMSSLPPKGQLRKDILPCALFVLQSAPVGLMRALWRKLAKRAEGKTLMKNALPDKYGGILGSGSGIGYNGDFSLLNSQSSQVNEEFEMDDEADIFDVFGLLNLALSTVEYEGSGNPVEESNGVTVECNEKATWRREFLLSSRVKSCTGSKSRPFKHYQHSSGVAETDSTEQPTTTDSRRWHAHDCSLVIINICRQIVREILLMTKPNLGASEASEDDFNNTVISGSRSLSDIFLQPTLSSLDDSESSGLASVNHEEGKAARMQKRLRKRKVETLTFAVTDSIIFVRAAASVYLHALSMKQSDVVITKTLTAAVEVVKIFGIKFFLSAIGETLQHWMRVILEHCGARRADLRVDACEFLNLLLRLTWESYGSFSRIRLPLLAVQSEVMERIVAKAARKYIIEQRRLGLNPVALSNDCAEASLTPLWRTIDRLHNQSASQNLSFKSALARLAIKMKKVYRAYLAAHALAIVNRSESGGHGDVVPSEPNPYVQRMRVSVHRIISNSAWFSKRFLGNVSVTLDRSMIQTEAVEDSFLIAADVFSSTDLPSHRVAWLQKLAEFHRMRGRFAEEATCRCMIYHTYREAAKQHDHIWSSAPFLPWASNSFDGVHPGGEGHAIVSDFDYEAENLSGGSGKQAERGNAFRRIFYRSADSVRVRSGDWGAVSGGKYLFYGVALKSEFDSVSQWYSHREMEENMVEEAEISGDLYLRAGIVESSRYAWSLANQYYSDSFNYARLAYVYRRLALVVTSQVPIIDLSNQLDLSSQIGRFYKVYFHGGAPDDLLHSQGSEGFIYRVPNSVKIRDFASRLESAVRCILPNKTTIDLLLDDGSPTMAPRSTGGKRSAVIGGAPIEPVKIKVTPLRPLFKIEDNEKCFRGTPEWFQVKAEEQDYENEPESGRNSGATTLASMHQRSHSTSTTNSLSSAGSLTMTSRRSTFRSGYRKSSTSHINFSHEFDKGGVNGELIGVDRFYFTQPIKKDPTRGFRDWLKVPKGRIAERSLRVTELQVENSFPACITRQKILHRAVFTQSPLEASVEAVSTWCSVLFRTVIATNGQGVLGGQRHQGLNADSAKLVMECIHSSGVKRIGVAFLTVNAHLEESNEFQYSPYESLDEEEIERVQTKLARMIVTFLELLHLLIARNRDVLLAVVQARKRNRPGDASSVHSGSVHCGYAATPRAGSHSFSPHKRIGTSSSDSVQGYGMYERSSSELVGRSIIAENHTGPGHVSKDSDRTDSAIGVQSELQRGLISLVKALSPNLLDTLNNEVPRWMRSIQDNYFSTGAYRQADIPIGEELFFNVDTSGDDDRGSKSEASYAVPRSIIRGSTHTFREGSPNGSLCSHTSDRRIDRTLSTASERPPTDRSVHRRNASGTSYASLKGVL